MGRTLAVKYRPQTFEDIVGQEVTVKILKNQIESGDHQSVYLFSGGAGTGKTTMARIVANELNGGKAQPIEIDAASHNGVDDIRALNVELSMPPIVGKYRIIILDECHMLTKAAWNALLKTLEEMPSHNVMIMCTTESQRVPETIMSRAQHFQFTSLREKDIEERLYEIAAKEIAVDIDGSGIPYIAKRANGGMRAAIAMMDKVSSYDSQITLDGTLEVIGGITDEFGGNLTNAIIKEDTATVQQLIQEIIDSGQDLRNFVKLYLVYLLELEKKSEIILYIIENILELYYNIRWENHPDILIMAHFISL